MFLECVQLTLSRTWRIYSYTRNVAPPCQFAMIHHHSSQHTTGERIISIGWELAAIPNSLSSVLATTIKSTNF